MYQRKIILSLGALLLAILVAYLFWSKEPAVAPSEVPNGEEATEQPATALKAYRLEAEGLEFTYEEGESGYTLEEIPVDQGVEPTLLRRLVLTPTSDYLDQQNRVGGEGSPNWSLMVYQNTENEQAAIWAEKNEMASNIQLATSESAEAVVAGANAVRYTTDGLYPAIVYVITHADMVYVVNASYLDTSSRTYTDLESWIASFKFIPVKPPTSQKIDPRVACESALTYMTFTDGAAADKFVEECVNGEHPEVIDRYIEGLNLDGATI